ncbi:hypothetical protein SNE40_008219 [Patella caerulea]|uniref:Uncharacterized protein n=1 Tax=Patella caerulea TaxID=87958 RepID=A0AAN8JYE8_PATCE
MEGSDAGHSCSSSFINAQSEYGCSEFAEQKMSSATQESQAAIVGAESHTVQQILNYLSNGVCCVPEDEESTDDEEKMRHKESSAATISRDTQAVLNSDDGDTLTTEELFRLIMSDHHYLKIDAGSRQMALGNDANLVPNAEDIQKFFLETINLIAFKPIKDVEPGLGQDLNSPNTNLETSKDSTVIPKEVKFGGNSNECKGVKSLVEKESKSTTTLTTGERENRKRARQIWTTECRAVLEKVQQNSLINHVGNLLQKYWRSYLATPQSEINEQAIQTAKELQQTDDVVEMLADKGRYVWQIIEEMPPKTIKLLED